MTMSDETISIISQLKLGRMPSEIFRNMFEAGTVTSNSELVDFIIRESEELGVAVGPSVMSWNRGTKPERIGIGLTDSRFDEVFLDSMRIAFQGTK